MTFKNDTIQFYYRPKLGLIAILFYGVLDSCDFDGRPESDVKDHLEGVFELFVIPIPARQAAKCDYNQSRL
jgi:hypothetical protein